MSTVTISNKCHTCPRTISINVERNAFRNWISGAEIQVAFPKLDSTERESLLTGFCSDCQDDLFDSLMEMQGI